MTFTVVYDATRVKAIPLNPPHDVTMAGYATGTGDVPWDSQLWARWPNAIRIDQSPVNTIPDELCDVLDVENAAATLVDIVPWVTAAIMNFRDAARPGQRYPAIYASASKMPQVTDTLTKANFKNTVALWVADWSYTAEQAVNLLLNTSGQFPVVGVQFTNTPSFDVSLFNTAWINNVSKKSVIIPPGLDKRGILVYSSGAALISKPVTSADGKTWE